MNWGDWASEKEVMPEGPMLRDWQKLTVGESVELIHHKVVYMNDEFECGVLVPNSSRGALNRNMQLSCGFGDNGWKAIMDLETEFFLSTHAQRIRPRVRLRVRMVAARLMKLTNQDWLDFMESAEDSYELITNIEWNEAFTIDESERNLGR